MMERWGLQAIFTSPDALASGSLSNLANRRIQSVAAWPAGSHSSSIKLVMQLPSNETRNVVCLFGDFTLSAQWKIRLSTDGTFSGADITYTTGAFYEDMFDYATLVGNDYPLYEPPFGRIAVWILPTDCTGSYFEFTIVDTTNPRGRIQVSFADAGVLWQPTLRGFDETVKMGADPVGAPGNSESEFPLHKVLRWCKFKQSWLTEEDQAVLRHHFLRYGRNGRLLFVPQPLSFKTFALDNLWGVFPEQPVFSPHEKLSYLARYQMDEIKFLEVDE